MTTLAPNSRILIVDDEDMLRRSTRRQLERAGYHCDDAPDAAVARQLLSGSPFDVVLCDVRMPGESGLSLIGHIRDAYPDTTTVMISGVDDTEVAQEALSLGAVGYVVKPFERNELLINVANALNRRTLSIENRRHRERLEELVELQANYDLLTGLANRPHLGRRLDLVLAADTDRRSAVVLFDLDHFQVINDSLGHEAGDTILKEVSRRLTSHVDEGDLAARFSGDAFVLLISAVDAGGDLSARADQILADLNRPHVVAGRELYVSASAGIVPDLSGYPNGDGVLRDADAAMHQAKSAGRATYRVVDEVIRARARKRLDIETGLRDAIDNDQLTVYYQPQFSLTDRRLVGFEALVRWRHPQLGLVLPGEFVPVAEETGLIIPLGRQVLRQAAGDLIEFRERAGDESLTMSVNVSAAQLVRGAIIDDMAETSSETGLDGSAFCIEITESVLLEGVAAAIRSLQALKEQGVRVSVDDFGTGYSSLSYIGKLPIDELKIDRSFVVDLAHENGAALVRGIISLAQALGHHVVAEGVETAEQLQQLEDDHCDMAQGFLLGRPAPNNVILDALDQGGRFVASV